MWSIMIFYVNTLPDFIQLSDIISYCTNIWSLIRFLDVNKFKKGVVFKICLENVPIFFNATLIYFNQPP